MRTTHVLAALFALVLAACATGESLTPSAASPSAAPNSRPAAATPRPTLRPTPAPPALRVKVVFDGETCTYFGPTVVSDGTVVLFDYAPDQDGAGSDLLVYGVQPGTSFDELVALAGEKVWHNWSGIPDGAPTMASIRRPQWVYDKTATTLLGAGTLQYTIESVKQGSDGVEYAVGGYQVMCHTPNIYPAAQLSVSDR